jgi:glutathione S-transferase
MRLFYTEGSPFARILRVAIIEKGLGARIPSVAVTLRDPASALLPYSPVGMVPALELDDGTILTESPLILPYLDTLHTGAKLLALDGSDGWRGMAELGQAMGFLGGIAVWNRALRPPPDERSPGVIAYEESRANRTADSLEQRVTAGAYSGPTIDGAQITLGAALGFCDRRHRVFAWRDNRPALAAWYERIAARPSFAATIPPETH